MEARQHAQHDLACGKVDPRSKLSVTAAPSSVKTPLFSSWLARRFCPCHSPVTRPRLNSCALRVLCFQHHIYFAQASASNQSGRSAIKGARQHVIATPSPWKGVILGCAAHHRGNVKMGGVVVQLRAGSPSPTLAPLSTTGCPKAVIQPVRGKPWIAVEDADCI